jgi:hypothetical protein
MKMTRHPERSEATSRDPVEITFKVPQRDPSASLGMTLLIALFLCCSAGFLYADTDAEVTARRNALDVAGAFTNDGFKLRDGHWCGTAKPQDHALIAVNLFAGNQYWFAVGTADAGKRIAVNVYDEGGKLITTEHYEAGDRAAAGFSPTDSGQYFVAVDLAEGAPTNFCLIYSYK